MCIEKLGFGAPVYFCHFEYLPQAMSRRPQNTDGKVDCKCSLLDTWEISPRSQSSDSGKGEETEPWMKLISWISIQRHETIRGFPKIQNWVCRQTKKRMIWKKLKAKGQLHSNNSQRRYHDIVKDHSLAFSKLSSIVQWLMDFDSSMIRLKMERRKLAWKTGGSWDVACYHHTFVSY